MLLVTCTATGVGAALSFMDGRGIFHDGQIEIRFDSETAESAEWNDADDLLAIPEGTGNSFAQKLLAYDQLLIRVTRWRGQPVTDAFNIEATQTAIDHLRCM